MTAFRRTSTTTSDLADAGLVSKQRAASIEVVGARYAVAVTPAIKRSEGPMQVLV